MHSCAPSLAGAKDHQWQWYSTSTRFSIHFVIGCFHTTRRRLFSKPVSAARKGYSRFNLSRASILLLQANWMMLNDDGDASTNAIAPQRPSISKYISPRFLGHVGLSRACPENEIFVLDTRRHHIELALNTCWVTPNWIDSSNECSGSVISFRDTRRMPSHRLLLLFLKREHLLCTDCGAIRYRTCILIHEVMKFSRRTNSSDSIW